MNTTTIQEKPNLMAWFFTLFLSLSGTLGIIYALSMFLDGINTYRLKSEGFDLTISLIKADPMYFFSLGFLVLALVITFIFFALAIFKENIKSYSNKFLISISIVMAIFAVFVVKFETKNELLVNFSEEVYNNIAKQYEDPAIFTNSTPAKEFKLALDNNNFEALKPYINNPKNIRGLSEADMFNKLLTVQNISNQSVRNEFDSIYADRYITIEEYNKFKNNATNSILHSLTAEIKSNTDNDKILAANL